MANSVLSPQGVKAISSMDSHKAVQSLHQLLMDINKKDVDHLVAFMQEVYLLRAVSRFDVKGDTFLKHVEEILIAASKEIYKNTLKEITNSEDVERAKQIRKTIEAEFNIKL
jgi:hypothetical protein